LIMDRLAIIAHEAGQVVPCGNALADRAATLTAEFHADGFTDF
jgi:hypothetical protein